MSKSKQLPPVPPANRSNKGPGGSSKDSPRTDATTDKESPPSNLAKQDRQGNIQQNTTNQGYQQDR
ncbi:MAG: hypothetical protein ACXW3H_10305 [Candidatus Aminicenantales bacterium]